jgi:hypothetical protein
MGLILKPEEDLKNAMFERHAHGAFIVDGIEVGNTLQCPHCNAHFLSIRGSKKRRAFCTRCGAVTCGKDTCDACIPFEQRIDLCEKIPGLEIDTVPRYLFLHPEIKIFVK